MATYKSTFSGAQMEDTFDKVQNKKITAVDVGAVPATRKVNNKELSADVALTASDVGAVPITRKINNKALSTDISLTAADVGSKRIYKDLGEISSALTTNSTPFEVANAMEDGSMLIMPTSGSYTYTGGLIPQAEHGILTIIKESIARVSFEFIGENTGFYDSFMRSISGNFKGWRRHYTTANLTVATTAPTSALANDAQVQVYDA